VKILSKDFYVVSGAIAYGSVLLLDLIGWISSKNWFTWERFQLYSLIPTIYMVIVMLVFTYQIWDAIQDGHTPVSPGKAVGFIFIPFFNLYWLFRVIWGFSKEFNAYIKRHTLAVPELNEKIFLAWCAFNLASGFLIGIITRIEGGTSLRPLITGGFSTICSGVFLVLSLKILSDSCSGVNSVIQAGLAPSPGTAKAGQGDCPHCPEAISEGARFCSACGRETAVYQAKSENLKTSCPQCGNKSGPGSLFCDICGKDLRGQEPQKQVRPDVCQRCQTEYLAEDLFCASCGAPREKIKQ
jgi:hypothetical protein